MRGFFVLLSMVVFLIGCTVEDSSLTVPEEEALGSEEEAGLLQEGEDSDVVEISVEARQWEFTPSEIVVSEGQTVRLRLQSFDVTHGFFLSAFGVNEVLAPGEERVVEFVADKVGEFAFSCSVPCGEGHSSMEGVLIVQ